MKYEAKNCVACGSIARVALKGRVECKNPRCRMTGPKNDRDAAKWNALPRRLQGRAGRKTPAWQRKGKQKVADSSSPTVKESID
jgi:hypothetical protein